MTRNIEKRKKENWEILFIFFVFLFLREKKMIDRFYTRDEVELGREIIILYDEDASLPRPLIAQGRHFYFYF